MMAPSFLPIVALGCLAVTMVTTAPLANNNEETVANLVAQADVPVDRAKRMDEEIFYNNEQNKAHVMNKKSGPLFGPVEPQGELDRGAKVIVHKEQPVSEEVKDRIEAAQEDTAQQDEYTKDLESSMHSIVNNVLADEAKEELQEPNDNVNDAEADDTEEHVVSETEDEEEVPSDGLSEQDNSVEEESGQPEVSQEVPEVVETSSEEGAEDEAEHEAVSHEEASEADDEEKELQEMTSAANSDKAATSQEAEASALSVEDVGNGAESPENQERQQSEYGYKGEINDPTNLFYNYLRMYGPYSRSYPPTPLDPYYRRRRSPAKARRNRRIKRDLLDDRLYNLYDTPSSAPSYYPSVDVNDALLSNADDYVPLTDSEAAVLYSRLLDYLEDALAGEEAEAEAEAADDGYEDPREEEVRYEPEFLPMEDEEDFEEEPYLAESGYPSDMPSPYDDGYPYGPVDLDTYTSYAKRGQGLYFPREDNKRSFFPYSDEPETHWGAFVPEKRDHSDAIQRLQRLAMALSDNSSPYYREILDDYRRK